MKAAKGFTLIELLVVIAIIAILMVDGDTGASAPHRQETGHDGAVSDQPSQPSVRMDHVCRRKRRPAHVQWGLL